MITREEAKKYLEGIASDLGFTGIEEYTYKDGVKMREAIKALEQEPCECFTCKYGEWKRKGWDITMADDKCGGCCSWNDKYEPLYQEQPDEVIAMLTELQLEIEEIVKEETLIDKKWANGLHYSEKIIQQKIDKLKGDNKCHQ